MSLYIYGMMKQHDAVESEYEYRKRLNPNEKKKKKVDLEYMLIDQIVLKLFCEMFSYF